MPAVDDNHKRAERSRANGAKSRGPTTPQGKERSQSAPLKHGLYAQPPSADDPQFAALRTQYQSVWNPENTYIADKIDDLVAYRWELTHLRELRRQYLADNPAPAELKNEQTALDRLDLRIRRCGLEISRIERDAIRTARYLSANGGSQKLWETKDVDPDPTQPEKAIAWAESTFGITLDDHQAHLLTTEHPAIVLNAARYSGKTTVLAIRALYESIQHPDAKIVCLSPFSTLYTKVCDLAAIGSYNIPNITSRLTESADIVLIDDAADLTSEPLINKRAKLILAATPGGASGYFYRQHHDPDTIRIVAPVEQCRFIGDSLPKLAKAKLPEAQYNQEFRCQFLAKAQPRCRLSPLTQ